ncbi:MAG: MAPEG family protein [Proteobacteria bacterium]|nr:MAPEG family protein [Pseudomonadota bacterium]
MLYLDVVIGLAALQFLYFGAKVGQARGRYGIKAPAVSGHEVFERHFRVQQNSLELLLLFYPGLYLFGSHISPVWAAAIGVVYLIGRQIYAVTYVKDPSSREAGFIISLLASVVLLLGGLGGAIWQMLR